MIPGRLSFALYIFLIAAQGSFLSLAPNATAQTTVLEGSYRPSPFVAPASNAANQWTALASALEPRVEGHSAFIDGKIYVFGGFQTEGIVPTDKNEVYDIATNSWSTFAPLPHPVTHVGSAEVDGKVWLAGGFAVLDYTQIVNQVWIYDSQADNWTVGPPLPQKRSAGAMVRLGRKLHYFGGLINRNDNAGDHYVLDLDEPGGPKTWTTAAPLPDPRDHLSGVSVGGKIYAIGGQFGHDVDPQDTKLLHVYDPATNTWTRLPDLPYIRSHYEPGTLVVDGDIIVAGGRSGTNNCVDDITRYDPVAAQWSHVVDMPACMIAPSAKVVDDVMYLSHGGVGSVLHPTTDAFKHTFERNPSDELGFWPDHVAAALNGSQTGKVESVIWTLTGEAEYSISTANLPSWIKSLTPTSGVADIPGGEVDITLDASGLSAGTYTHTLVATASGYQQAELKVSLIVGGNLLEQDIKAGWNLVGLPVAPSNSAYTSVYSAVNPPYAPYAYEGGYSIEPSLGAGKGYWLYAGSAGLQTLSGSPVPSISYSLEAGWNLISGPACTFPLSEATGDTDIWTDGAAYGYSQADGYTPSTHLVPGKGYWIETSQAGNVTMDCAAL